jgi:hypothetical protein
MDFHKIDTRSKTALVHSGKMRTQEKVAFSASSSDPGLAVKFRLMIVQRFDWLFLSDKLL